jgi:threonine/homoserine/homoserine lactone efflux protein
MFNILFNTCKINYIKFILFHKVEILYIIHLALGVIVSYLVALPLRPVNLAILESSIRYGKKVGIQISLGSAFAELFYCLLAVWGVNKLFSSTTVQNHSIFQLLQISSIPVLFWIGIANIRKKESVLLELNPSHNSFLLGAFLNLINPMLLPLWLGISSYLTACGLLDYHLQFLSFFAAGVALGTFLLHFTLTIISSHKLVNLTTRKKIIFTRIIGFLFIFFGLYQIFLLIAPYISI